MCPLLPLTLNSRFINRSMSFPKMETAALLLLLVVDPTSFPDHNGVDHLMSLAAGTLHPAIHPAAAVISTKQPTVLPNSPALRRRSVPPWRHDVFLSFRGVDVRHTFCDHLYRALVRKGIKVFRDETDLPRGDIVAEAISAAIEHSKLSIIVLSRGYASSEWCLDELVKIMLLTTKEKGRHQTFPVFYQLSPDDVADYRSSGCYKADFGRHKKMYSYERVEGWSRALTSIAGVSGWLLPRDRSEAEMVEKIAKNMLCKVRELGRDREPSWSPVAAY